MKTAESVMVKVPVLSLSDHITRARQILRDDIFREVYVQDDRKHLAGYVDITDALRITDTRSNVTVEGFVKDPVTVISQGTVIVRYRYFVVPGLREGGTLCHR
jgi:CBS domain-containing protein